MEKIPRFKKGEWILTDDGICQVYDSKDYFVEDFFEQDFENKKVGDVFENKLVYKIFCHFDDSPRKAKFFNFSSSNYCKPISGEYLQTLRLCKDKNPQLYEKILTRKPSKPVTSRVEFSLRFEPNNRDNAVSKMNELFKLIPKPFNFQEFDNYFKKNLGEELPNKLYAVRDTLMTNALVSLEYRILEPREMKFCFVNGKVIKTHCSYDE